MLKSTRVGSLFIHHQKKLERFVGPVLGGIVVSAVLYLVDVLFSARSSTTGRALHFIEATVKHIDATVIVLGAFLVALCAAMTGWLPIRSIRRIVVLPFVEFIHHSVLLGAGALIALIAGAVWSGEPVAVVGTLVIGALTLLIGGAEAQIAVWYCQAKEEELYGGLMPKAWHVGFGLIGLWPLGSLLVKQISGPH